MQTEEALNQQLWFEVQAMHKAWTDLHMDRFLSKHQQVKEEAMKVQAKLLSDHYQYEVIEESSNYYIVYGTGGKVAVSKADYEPVEEWKDVTHECTLKASVTGVYCIYRLGYVVNPSNTAHRVTCKGSTFKVEVKR